MADELEEDEGTGVGIAALALVLGLICPLLYNAVTWSQGLPATLIVFFGFATCNIYGVIQVSMPSAEAFGFGMLMMSVFALDIWLGILSVAAMSISIVRYAMTSRTIDFDGDVLTIGSQDPSPGQ